MPHFSELVRMTCSESPIAPSDKTETSMPVLPNFRTGSCGVWLCCFPPAVFGSFPSTLLGAGESAFACEAKTDPKPAAPIVRKKILLLNSLFIDNSL
jgi:hypothetical protein